MNPDRTERMRSGRAPFVAAFWISLGTLLVTDVLLVLEGLSSVGTNLLPRNAWFGIFLASFLWHVVWYALSTDAGRKLLDGDTYAFYIIYVACATLQLGLFLIPLGIVTFSTDKISDERFRDYVFLFLFASVPSLIVAFVFQKVSGSAA